MTNKVQKLFLQKIKVIKLLIPFETEIGITVKRLHPVTFSFMLRLPNCSPNASPIVFHCKLIC